MHFSCTWLGLTFSLHLIILSPKVAVQFLILYIVLLFFPLQQFWWTSWRFISFISFFNRKKFNITPGKLFNYFVIVLSGKTFIIKSHHFIFLKNTWIAFTTHMSRTNLAIKFGNFVVCEVYLYAKLIYIGFFFSEWNSVPLFNFHVRLAIIFVNFYIIL